MFGQPFYHNTLRKIVASFGAIFANIYVVKRGENSTELERLKVPLAYGPAEKYLVRTLEDPELNRNFAIKLPRMSFQISSIEYDSQRKLNTIKKNASPIANTPGDVIRQYQGVPYKIGMELNVISKYINDANQIIEQILPWFTPAFSITINSIPEMEYKDDIAIVLNSVTLQDNYEDDWTSRRDIIWTLTFDIKAMFYGPMVNKELITTAITDVYSAASADLQDPRQLQTIARASRGTLTTTPADATYRDEFGYTESFEGFFDGKVRDPATGEDVAPTNKITPEEIPSKTKVESPEIS